MLKTMTRQKSLRRKGALRYINMYNSKRKDIISKVAVKEDESTWQKENQESGITQNQ